MGLRILHTADWHLGQRFYDYDRTEEHEHFLNWLVDVIEKEQIDVLLIAGDIFDVTNPTSAAQRLFYNFLYNATHRVAGLQIILTAGNHDSPARLEAPAVLMETFNVSVIGAVKRNSIDNEPDWQSVIIPLMNRKKEIKGYCLAVPYLRPGDYEIDQTIENPYNSGIYTFYQQLYLFAQNQNKESLPIIAMGHLHTAKAVISDSEKGIRGGLEVVESDAFPQGLSYVALGHIHKAQTVGGKSNMRYSGSPLPMSFSEVNYKHQVIVADIESHQEVKIQEIPIPRLVDLKRIGTPVHPLPKKELLQELQNLPDKEMIDGDAAPYLEINILLDSPDLMINQEIKDVLLTKHVRLARNVAYYPSKGEVEELDIRNIEDLKDISPLEMLSKHYQNKYSTNLPDELIQLFNVVLSDIQQDN